MYRTGDYGRLDARGLLTIEGRVAGDAQVKVRGFRVELGEIEDTIIRESSGALSQVVVTLRPGENDHDDYLTAHVVMENRKDNNEARANELIDRPRTRLSLALPQYMIPAVILPIHEIPLTAHGKVDRKTVQAPSLPELSTQATIKGNGHQKDLTPTERRLVHLWVTVLPAHSSTVEPFAPESDFFRLGGNSFSWSSCSPPSSVALEMHRASANS